MIPFALLVLFGQSKPAPPLTTIPFKVVGFGSNGKIKEGGAIVIRSDKALDAYRKQMATTQGRKPTVNWSTDQIVALHAVGTGYGGASLQVNKVSRADNGSLQIEAFLDLGSRPATPTPGVMPVLRREGIYALVVVSQSKGEVVLKIIDPPTTPGGKSGSGV